jgi:hypothetical protein
MRWKRTAAAFLCALAVGSAAHAGPRHAATHSLEGLWWINSLLPIEATPKTPNLVVPEAEARTVAAAVNKEVSDLFIAMLDPEFPVLVANSEGLPIVRGQRRTRAVVQPASGLLPYTAAARKEADTPPPDAKADNPEDRNGAERCIVQAQPPLNTFTLDDEMLVLVTRDNVVIYTEYGDEVRIVPITDKHGPKALYGHLGDSIGHWEGRTLVIETIGMPDGDRDRFFPVLVVPGEAKVIERLSAISDKELLYQFTVVDPKTYTAPWLGEFSWHRTTKAIYESACHEGNYGLPNILAGARYEERTAKAAPAATAAKGTPP